MKKIFSLIVITMTISGSLFGQDLFDKENGPLSWSYQQKAYQLNDPEGDVLLLYSINQVPAYIASNLKGTSSKLVAQREKKVEELLEKYPEFKVKANAAYSEIVEDYSDTDASDEPIVLEGHKAPFLSKNIALMMGQVITEEYKQKGIVPTYGEIHKWSSDKRVQSRRGALKILGVGKLLACLSRGVTSRYLVTGTETELIDYVITRPTNSVTLEEMFRQSYLINGGDVYLTVLTIENALSRSWNLPHREKLIMTTKLKDITNYNYETDKFGSWYHLFGVILYGYVEGGLKASLVGNTESWGSAIMGRFADEKQEDFVNSRGGRVGGKLKDFVKKEKYLTFQEDKNYLQESFYLSLNEDFSKRIAKSKAKKKD
jgi:hypothetical protein